jgi:hypothetical protein
MNKFDEMRAAITEADQTMRAADEAAHKLACILRGRLKHVGVHVLVELKRELQSFDAHKKEWK